MASFADALFRHLKTKQNSENIFFADREDKKATILYVFLISQVDLQGNLKIDGTIEKSQNKHHESTQRNNQSIKRILICA